MQNEIKTIDFKRFSPEDKDLYNGFLFELAEERGCEFSFGNLFLWGRQSFTQELDGILFFSQFDRRTVYPCPITRGELKPAFDAIIADARARGIPCRITGLTARAAEELTALYPERFKIHHDRASFDYVYAIDDLAELKGKRYHSKKNHLNRFTETYSGYTAEPITKENLSLVERFLCSWYEEKEAQNPDNDFLMEKAALARAIKYYEEIGLEGLLLTYHGEVIAFTMGSRLSKDTFDVHFEKARADINGAYTAINYEYARYIRQKHPDVKFLDREEDMGIEGLRRAKESYKPHHMVEKFWAHLLEDGYDY